MAGSSDYMRSYRTPQRTPAKRKRKGSMSTSSGGVDALLSAAADSSGYGSAYRGAKLAVNLAKKFYNAKRTQTKNQANTKVSHVRKGGMYGKLAGKLKKKGKRVNRNYSALKQKGILTREEFRFQDDIATNNESRVIGHTSLPIRATYYNLFRALIKSVMLKAGVTVPALTETTQIKGSFQIFYYSDWSTGTLLNNAYAFGGLNPLTWKVIMDGFADWFLTLQGAAGNDPLRIRWKSFEYRPEVTYVAENLSRVIIDLGQTYCTIHSKSMLKIQNQSGVYKGAGAEVEDATSDDVDCVPIELSTYYVTGNQFIHQSARTSIPVGLGFLGFQTTYFNSNPGSEPPPAYEILNCTNRVKITMDPGHIKTSIISYKKKMLFGQALRLLIRRSSTGQSFEWNDNAYIKNAGHSRILHADRVIGATSGKVRLMGEVEVQQTVMVSANRNVATDQYETQNG